MEVLETIIVPTRIQTGGIDAILTTLHGLPKFHLRTGHKHPTLERNPLPDAGWTRETVWTGAANLVPIPGINPQTFQDIAS